MTPETTTVMLAPESVLVTKNIRFGLKKYRVNSLAESIRDFGRVHTNLKVEPLATPGPNGEQYALREGHYRKAAVELLNKEGAGLELPCTVEEPLEGTSRTLHQISENLDRENLSPMDMAVAINELLVSGMPKKDICTRFSRPGGRKGLAMQPLSNAMLNIYVSFLEFPKSTQSLIHDGKLGVADAYKLTRRPREEWAAILGKAEETREAEIAAEEKISETFESEQAKVAEQEAKAIADQTALEAAQKIAEAAAAESKAKLDAAAESYKNAQAIPAKDKDARKQAEEVFKGKEAEAKAAEKEAEKSKAAAEKLQAKAEANTKLAKERADKLAQARKDATKKLGDKKLDVTAATAAVNGGLVALKGPQILKMLQDLSLPGSFPKVTKIAQAILRCINSEITDAQLLSELGFITGERKDKPKHVKG